MTRLRQRWSLVATLGCLTLTSTLTSCSAEHSGRVGAARARAPTEVRSPTNAASSPPRSAAPAERSEPLRLDTFTPLLATAALTEAARAVEAEDLPAAVDALERAMAEHPPPAAQVLRWQMLLGTLRERAGDLTGAAASYELAAAQSWPLASYAKLGAGRVLLRAGRPEQALEQLGGVASDQPIAQQSQLLAAESAELLGDHDEAIAIWERYLATMDTPARERPADWVSVALRLGEALLARAGERTPDGERTRDLTHALALARRVAIEGASSGSVLGRARALEQRALSALPPAERARFALLGPEEMLAQLRLLAEGGNAEEANQLAQQLLARLGKAGRWSVTGCEASFYRAKALGRLRQWGKGADLLTEPIARCADPDLRARALYVAGKFSDYDKRYTRAVVLYDQLEREIPGHRLADDARLRAALDFQRMGVEARFTELLSTMAQDYPQGDMVLDGLFALALRRIEKRDWAGAAAVLEPAAQLARPLEPARGHELSGRERYFLARAWTATGEPERAAELYEQIVSDLPLSYYMLHAYTRLHHHDSARAARALEVALERSVEQPFSVTHHPEFDSPGFRRALELSRQGDVTSARQEVEALGLLDRGVAPSLMWSVALLYARAGAHKLAHDVARGLLTDWLERWPSGEWSRAWEIAFPRPYEPLVLKETSKHDVPPYLAYAIMREESAFDPEAVSHANAYGLMQLIEPTARHTARGTNLPSSPQALKRPPVNIALGCKLLGSLTRRFSANPLLAIPGYNAGPGRPKRWAMERPDVDFDVWVELIPFRETLRYTKRVLASRAAYAFLYHSEHANQAMLLPIGVDG